MGRTITVAGNDMLVTYDFRDDGDDPLAQLYDVTDPLAPQLKAEWGLDCSPFGATMRKGFDNFALSCTGGQLYIGTLTADRAQSQLKKVRDFDRARRALYLDPKRDLLFAFVSDPEQVKLWDAPLKDELTYDENTAQPIAGSGPNEVPDDMENSRRHASDVGRRHLFQFVVIDLKTERNAGADQGCIPDEIEDCHFPLRSDTDPIAKGEYRWIYFKLNNFDGTPDASDNALDPNFKYYRTNFWETQPDPEDPDVFYLSHRGNPKNAPHANQIVRVTMLDNPLTQKETQRAMTFDRVYGFKGQATVIADDGSEVDNSKYHFPTDFVVEEVAGQKLLVVNHFRDLVNWVSGDRYFALSAQVIDDLTWFTEVAGNLKAGDVTSYYQVAMNRDGRLASCSFYGNAVMIMQVNPGLGIETVKRVE
jgi:hypothetical protein